MKTISKLIVIAGLIAGAATSAIAGSGSGASHWQTLRKEADFKQLKTGDKIVYVCNQCQTVTEKTIESTAEAMNHCKEGATVMCPSCKTKVRVVMKGPPKNPMPTREVTYVNEKGEPCLFVAKVTDKK